MIKFRDQVPSIYTNASRDFQYLSWLIDIVLNAVKHNVDGIYNLPNTNAEARLTELLAMTLGFKVKRNYDQKQLAALVAALPRILKYKGTLAAITMAGEALIATSGAVGNLDIKVRDGELEVTLPKNLVDVSLFTDLLPYILPAGMTCHIVRADIIQKTYATEVKYHDYMLAKLITDFDWDSETQTFVGLANMSDVPTAALLPVISISDGYVSINGVKTAYTIDEADAIDKVFVEGIYLAINTVNKATKETKTILTDYKVYEPSFANFKDYNISRPNLGLLDNNIIPSLYETVRGPSEEGEQLSESND